MGGLWLCEPAPEQEVVVGRSTKGARRFCLVAACKLPPRSLSANLEASGAEVRQFCCL